MTAGIWQETELWNYLSMGDGNSCPLRESCENRARGGWCLSDQVGCFFNGRESSAPTNDDEDELGIFRSLFRRYFPFSFPWRPGHILKLVETLAQDCLAQTAVTHPPVGEDIIGQLGIEPSVEIRLLPLRSNHGAVWHLEDAWVVHVNSYDTPVRQRWTVFHEVFHILAARSKAIINFRKPGSRDGRFNELLADYFATCVLLPADWVTEAWTRSHHSLAKLAEEFQVPEVAAWVRLKTRGLI